jgi:hypothetical protein
LPHVLQFADDCVVSTHVPLQLVRFEGHAQWPVPSHFWPFVHVMPQPPQFWSSLLVFTHAPPQFVVGLEQLVVQVAFWHALSLPQTLPQPPQLFGSVIGSLQVPASPPQLRSAGHVHAPL